MKTLFQTLSFLQNEYLNKKTFAKEEQNGKHA